ncbi:MAG: system, alpha-glucoside-specific subunit [Massilibacillus sp.]|nr:system, alpha-glucoside-specific subunit [Massilibacillus sp.]
MQRKKLFYGGGFMTINKDVVMQNVQRFGGAMFTPVILFSFFGIMVSLSIIFKNPDIVGSIATKGTAWYNVWYVIEQGAWTVFAQMPLLFALSLPIGLAKKNQARACMESFVIYVVFNYFVSGILTLAGPSFGVDYSLKAGGGTGLAMIANIKTLDIGMLGAILISGITVWLHNRLFDVDLPDYLGIFKGSSLVVAAGFFLMLPVAYLFCLVWPSVQHVIGTFQEFLKASDALGVWMYTFCERILIPTGLHHFIYTPFIFGPAIVDGGIQQYWLQHLQDFATSAQSLKEMFPGAGFSLHGSSKIFGIPGIALAIYATAKPAKKKAVAGLLIPATITAVICGITEPLEFTFLFVAPVLFAVHAVLAATLAATFFLFGVVGSFGGGLIDALVQNWIPLFKYHSATYIMQIVVGLCFTAIYYFVFRYLIVKNDYKTPGRTEDDAEDKLYSKAEYKAKIAMEGTMNVDERDIKAAVFLEALGGKENIKDVTNCATRLRVTVVDDSLIKGVSTFTKAGAHGLVKNGHAVQVIVGLSVPQVRERFEALLQDTSDAETASGTDKSTTLKAFVSGKVIPITKVKDEMFSQKMMGDGIAVYPENEVVTAPADGEITMVMDGSGHAVGMRLVSGVEVLIHIGIDTVKMEGRGFNVLVKQGQKVRAGQALVNFDKKQIEKEGYSSIVILAVTNYTEYPLMKLHSGMTAKADETVIATF